MDYEFDIVVSLDVLKHNDTLLNAAASLIGSFNALDYSDHERDIQDILMAESFIDKSRFVPMLVGTYRKHAISVLEEFMYEVDEHKDISVLAKVLAATVDLSNTRDYQPILNIIENNEDEPPLEILSTIIAEISDVDEVDFQEVVLSVPKLFINRVRNRMLELQNEDVLEYKVRDNVDRIKNFISNNPSCLAEKLIRSGVQIGNTLDFYLSTLDSNKQPTELAVDIYSVSLMVNGDRLELDEEIRNYVYNTLYPTKTPKAMTLISELSQVRSRDTN